MGIENRRTKDEFNVATALPSTHSHGCWPSPCPKGSSVVCSLHKTHQEGFPYRSIMLKLCCIHLKASFPSPAPCFLCNTPTHKFISIIPPSQIYFTLLPSKFNLTSPLSHPLLFLNALGSSPSSRLCFCFPTTGGLSSLLFTSSPCFKIHFDNSLSYI